MDILDQIISADMANEYTDSQQLARVKRKTLTFDGDQEGKETLPYEVNGSMAAMVRVSDMPVKFTKENIKKLNWTFSGEISHDLSGVSVIENDATMPGRVVILIAPDGAAYQLVMAVDQDLNMGDMTLLKGVYFLCADENFYTTLLEIETVHQIDQKFIPGVVLPVIKAKSANDSFLLDETESIKATNAYNEKIPLILQLETDNETQIFVMALVINEKGVAYVFQTGNIQVLMAYQGDQWAGAIFITETTAET